MAWYSTLMNSDMYKSESGSGLKPKIVTWADGTDEEIAAMLEAHYNNDINVQYYWSVGDERVVHLSAITAEGENAMEAQPEQDIILVLLNQGGKELVTPINGHTECAFVVGQKDCLLSSGKLFTSNSTTGWPSSPRKAWCNSKYKDALPLSLVSIFKQYKDWFCNQYSDTSASSLSSDYFRLPTLREITGNSYTYDKAAGYYTQLKYYTTSSNIQKKIGDTESNYWTSTKYYTTSSTASQQRRMMYINTDYSSSYAVSTSSYGIAPQGVI